MKRIKIAHLYPNELNLYGDGGNVLCLYKRITRRHFKADVIPVEIGERIPEADILFIGGGQDREMKIISNDLRKKSETLCYLVNSKAVILAICGGFQLLGEYYKTHCGELMKLSGALPFFTIGSDERMIGNFIFDTPFGKIAGFENHSGRTYLSEELTPLGKIISGYGNNGEDKTEGLLYNNTFATYAHGPLLPKNPLLADEIIRRAVKTHELSPLDDEIETTCHNQLVERFG